MSEQYKPETIAVATVRREPNVRVHRTHYGYWYTPREIDGFVTHTDRYVTDIRPLAVLDLSILKAPVSCLIADLRDGNWPGIADQIEEQAKPPKPAEPTGLGAVVVDTEDRIWVRTTVSPAGSPAWRSSHWADDAPLTRYDDIPVAEEWSRGTVQP